MRQYKELIKRIMTTGELSDDRTGTGTRRIFGAMMEFNCSSRLPLVTVKYTHYPAIIHELIWFIKGDTNINYLQRNGVRIWDEWADDTGEVGPMYGAMWRGTNYNIDQLAKAIDDIKNNPTSRRIIIDCWDPEYIPDIKFSPQENVKMGNMALAPCHMLIQFYVRKNGVLDMLMYQRSVDSFLGLPFNIASYAILLNLVAQVTGRLPGKLTWMGGDCHLYNNHVEQVEEMLTREPKSLPMLRVNPELTDINKVKFDDIEVLGYEYHPKLVGKISV